MHLGLFRFAAEIEVRFHAEPILRLDDFQDFRGYALCRFVKAVWSASAVGQQDAKENCRGTTGIHRQRVPDPHDVRS